MPRVTTQQQLERFAYVKRIYSQNRDAFDRLPRRSRVLLHLTYGPSWLVDEAAFLLRLDELPGSVSRTQQTGRAFRELQRVVGTAEVVEPPPRRARRGRRSHRVITVRSDLRESIDVSQLAKIIVDMAVRRSSGK